MLLRTDCRVAGVDFGGFDTHNGQLPQHESLMQVLGWGLNSVYQDTVNVANNEVLILVVTEFGRTNAVNNSDGTDHGVGALCMAIGVNVRPGVYNCAANPNSFGEAWTTLGHNMTGIYENAVPTKTHFQTMIAEVCQRHFGLTAPQTDIVVPGFSGHAPTGIYRQLGFLL